MPERYEAMTGNTMIEVADDLDGILNILDALFTPDRDEDCVVWRIDRNGLAHVAALYQDDGCRLILEGPQAGRYHRPPSPPAEDPIVATLERVFWPRSGRRK